MGHRAVKSLQRFKKLPREIANVLKPRAGAAFNPLCFSHKHNCQWSPHGRERDHRRWQSNKAVIPSILCVRGPQRIQKILLIIGKDLLCCCHERLEAST
jgi:hypothetical protein